MSSKGMAAYRRVKSLINLSDMPDPKREYTIEYPKLNGGLNLYETEYRLDLNESPEMKNLLWMDGALGCRDGQEWLSDNATLGVGHSAHSDLFWGYHFFHIGAKLYYASPDAEPYALTELCSGVPEVRGTFFRYQDYLFYKTYGAYIRIAYDSGGTPIFTASTVPAYTPVIVINAAPANGSGDMYQPENRISAKKTVWYNAATQSETEGFIGDGATTVFTLNYTSGSQARLSSVDSVYIDGASQSTANYTVDLSAGTVTFTTAPTLDSVIVVGYSIGVYVYYLPVASVDGIESVVVDGTTLTLTTDYSVNFLLGTVTFVTAPPVTDPATNNTVKITYAKANTDAYNSVMDCVYAQVYGGDQNVCVVMAGCSAQPNAYFWNGNHATMDAGYFPMEQYNLGGDTEDAITGFGRQQDSLIIFKNHSIGRSELNTTEINDRVYLSLPYTQINSAIGCDLPWSIQLIKNNLTWCNTERGVYYLTDTSAAYENSAVLISLKVNGAQYEPGQLTAARPGLLYDLRAVEPDTVCGLDDGTRYWIVANGHAFVWDYELSAYSSAVWFYFTNIRAVAFLFTAAQEIYHLDGSGRVTRMVRTFSDYGEAIDKVFQFAVQNFGYYDRYKNVNSVIFVVRSDTDTLVNITYRSDWEERNDLTPIVSYCWRLVPRNLLYRFLGAERYATVARRRPGCKNVRHFSMRLENNVPGNDLSVISAQIFYTLQGRQR